MCVRVCLCVGMWKAEAGCKEIRDERGGRVERKEGTVPSSGKGPSHYTLNFQQAVPASKQKQTSTTY